jgi:hypothetical protein
MKKPRTNSDAPGKKTLQSMKDALVAYMDKRGMRSAREKAYVERIKQGVKRRQAGTKAATKPGTKAATKSTTRRTAK